MNRELPKVSVVTITYGHEKYITETLDGVLMQQYDGPVEFIIANDNSPDATDEVVKKYFLENPAPSNFEIKYTKHETNKGMMPNFIWALEQATGKYIAICEGDDYWIDPLKLQKQVCFLEENKGTIFSFTAANILTRQNKMELYYKHKDFKTGIINKKQFLLNVGADFCTASALFKKEIIIDLPVYFTTCKVGDFPLGLLALSKGKIGFCEDITTVYRAYSEGSWSSQQTRKSMRDQFKNIFDTMDQFNAHTQNKFFKLINFYKNEYRYKLVYGDIILAKPSEAIVLIFKNFSLDYKKNYKMIKILIWKIVKSKK